MAAVSVQLTSKPIGASRPLAGSFGDSMFVIDQSRCIGCRACVQACAECGTHRGRSLIHLDEVDRGTSTQTVPMVCMHCDDPTCAEVCPADAIKQNEDGVVQSIKPPLHRLLERCVLLSFGVPNYEAELDQMMKCDMCYDRTSEGLQADVEVGVPERRPVVRDRRGVRRAADGRHPRQRVAVRQPAGGHEGPHGRRWRRPHQGRRRSSFRWQDDPFGADDENGR